MIDQTTSSDTRMRKRGMGNVRWYSRVPSVRAVEIAWGTMTSPTSSTMRVGVPVEMCRAVGSSMSGMMNPKPMMTPTDMRAWTAMTTGSIGPV